MWTDRLGHHAPVGLFVERIPRELGRDIFRKLILSARKAARE